MGDRYAIECLAKGNKMNSGAWDDDDQDRYPPRAKVDIGQNVRVLRPAVAKPSGRRKAWFLIAPIAALVVGAVDIAFRAPASAWHHGIPPAPAFIFLGGFLVSFLIALPGLLKIGREQATQELRVGELGMEIVQILVPSRAPMATWAIRWQDIASIKFRYRGVQDSYAGLLVTSNFGQTQFLRPADWTLAEGRAAMPVSVESALISDAKNSKRQALEQSVLVRMLKQRGIKIDDDVPRPQDKLAAILGLSLGIGAIVAALIFNYIETR